MIPQRYTDLIHAELDGVNTPAQSAELRRWLEDHPEGRAELETLRATAGLLAGAAEDKVEPPAALRGRIMDDVRARAAAAPRRARIVRPRRGWGWPAAPAVSYALVAGCGVAAGVLLSLALTRGGDLPGRPGDYRGALAPLGPAAAGVAEPFTLGPATGRLAAARDGGLVVVDLELSAPGPLRAELSWSGPARLAGLAGLGPEGATAAAPDGLAAGAGGVGFDTGGATRCRFVLRAEGEGPVALRLALAAPDGARHERAFVAR